MNLREKQRQWTEDYLLIEHPMERLQALVDRRSTSSEPLSEAEKIDQARVHGCVSQVWVVGRKDENGLCHFQSAADSPMVAGLVRILTDLCSGFPPDEITRTPLTLINDLQLDRQLSPTRMNGLQEVVKAITVIASNYN